MLNLSQPQKTMALAMDEWVFWGGIPPLGQASRLGRNKDGTTGLPVGLYLMFKLSSTTSIWLFVIIVGAGIIAFSSFTRDAKAPEPATAITPTAFSPTDSPSIQPTFSPTPQNTTSAAKTATCQLSGSIKFINDNLYEIKGAKIVYQNVDDTIRHILWKTNPDDGWLIVGPNLFEQLPVPNGEREVGVTLSKNTGVKLYILAAQVTYGVKTPQGGEVVKEADCTGTVSVTLP